MRKLSAWAAYYLGCAAYWALSLGDFSERWVNAWYPLYNWLMIKSVSIQGDNDGPWEKS